MQQLFKNIQNSYHSLPQAQKAVAEYIIDHYQSIPFQSVTTMAKEIGVSDTTIIKYCMQIGFSGFGDFKRKIADYVQGQSNWYNKLEQGLNEIESQDPFAKVYQTELNNLKSILTNPANRQSYDKLLPLLEGAENIYILGFRSSSFLAQFMALGLGQQGYRTFAVCPGSIDYHELVFRMTPKDLLISFCYSQYVKDGIRIIQHAVKSGVPHVTFTDSPMSPSAADAECVFLCSVQSYSTTPSLTSAFSLINIVLAGCAQRHPERAKQHLLKLEEFVSGCDYYYSIHDQKAEEE